MRLPFLVLLVVVAVNAIHIRIPEYPGIIEKFYKVGITAGREPVDGYWDLYLPRDKLVIVERLTSYEIVPMAKVESRDLTHYTSYYELMKLCSDMENQYPTLAKKFVIGRSVRGKELLGVKITSGPIPKRRKIKLIGNMHGDETVGREILIKLIRHLLENYETDADIKKLVDETEIHILPSMNPDGFNLRMRTNAYGYDLNRNFPDRFFGQITPVQVETKAVMDWSLRENFTLSANFHGGDLVANYPYDGNKQHRSQIETRTKDDALFRRLATAYASNHPDMKNSKRFPGGIVNGANWYVLYGGMQDWNYEHTKCREITLEVSMEKYPHGTRLETYWVKNRKSMIEFMKQVYTM